MRCGVHNHFVNTKQKNKNKVLLKLLLVYGIKIRKPLPKNPFGFVRQKKDGFRTYNVT